VEEACSLLAKYGGRAVLNAGGTDLLSTLKGEHLETYPEAVINGKTIAGLDYIKEDGRGLEIGAFTTLDAIIKSAVINERCPLLSRAAATVATPQVRNAATVGGNLCQDVRCWYYRYPRHIGGPLICLRKGRGACLAVRGDNRYHAIMQAKKCFAVCPSDLATVLSAFDGEAICAGPKGERGIAIGAFFNPLGNALTKGEMVTGIRVPAPVRQARQTFSKFTLRKPVDFAIVSVACVTAVEGGICTDVRLALGAVGPGPVRAVEAEDFVKGKAIDAAVSVEAAALALRGARHLSMNKYKVEISRTLVRRALAGE
jgi:xanthine dehydrogenase YagS FAD-binding subunit